MACWVRSDEWKITSIHIHQHMGCYTNGSVLLLCIICIEGLAWNKPDCNWLELYCFHHGILLSRVSSLASCKWTERGSNKNPQLHGKSQWKPIYDTKRCPVCGGPNNICKKGGWISRCLSLKGHKHKQARCCWTYNGKKCSSKSILRWLWVSSWANECITWHSKNQYLWPDCRE